LRKYDHNLINAVTTISKGLEEHFGGHLVQLTNADNAYTLHYFRCIGDKTAMEKRGISQLPVLIMPPTIQRAPADY
jgi:hypothetical protein